MSQKRRSIRGQSARVCKGLTERLKAGDALVVNDLKCGSHKTKGVVRLLNKPDRKGTKLEVGRVLPQA